MSSGMRVFFITGIYGTHHGGSLYSHTLVQNLVDQGGDVVLVTEELGPFTGSHRELPSIILRAFFKSGLTSLPSRLVDVCRLFKQVRRARPDLLIVQGDLPRLTYIFLQRMVPLMFIRQDAILTCPANNRFLRTSRTVCKRPVGFGCLAVHRREKCFGRMTFLHRLGRVVYRLRDRFLMTFLKSFVGNSHYILGIHRQKGAILYPPRIGADPQNDVKRCLNHIVFCGRLEAVKGAEDALRIVKILPPHYSLDILGDGWDSQQLKQLAADLGLSDKVRFRGWVSPIERDRIFAASGVLLVPSLWDEAFGMVGIEAFAQGTPVVAYDVGGISEWCAPEAGVLVKCGDIPAAAAAVEAVTSSPSRWAAFSAAASQIAASKFTPEYFSSTLSAVVRPLVADSD